MDSFFHLPVYSFAFMANKSIEGMRLEMEIVSIRFPLRGKIFGKGPCG